MIHCTWRVPSRVLRLLSRRPRRRCRSWRSRPCNAKSRRFPSLSIDQKDTIFICKFSSVTDLDALRMSSTSGSPVVPSKSPPSPLAVAAPSGASGGADAWAAAVTAAWAAMVMFSWPSTFCQWENGIALVAGEEQCDYVNAYVPFCVLAAFSAPSWPYSPSAPPRACPDLCRL